MKNKIIIGGKLLLIGLLTTIVRIVGQLFMPAGTQDVLKPSIYVNNGTMPMAFTIYGILAYTIIAFMFLIVKILTILWNFTVQKSRDFLKYLKEKNATGWQTSNP